MNDDELEREVRDLLSCAGAVPHTPAPLRDGWQQRGEEALARTLRDTAEDAPVPPGPDPAPPVQLAHRRRLRVAVTVLAAAAAIAAVLVIAPWQHGGDKTASVAEAATPPMLSFPSTASGRLPTSGSTPTSSLTALSSRAAKQSTSGTGDVQYVSLASWWTSVDDIAKNHDRATEFRAVYTDSYLFASAKLRVIDRLGPVLDAAGHLTGNRTASSDDTVRSDRTITADYSPAAVAALPTAPTALARALAKAAGCLNLAAHCLLEIAGQIESTAVVTPTLQSAIWSALKLSSGLTYLGHVTDRLGRTAAAFMTTSWDPTQRQLVFADPSTGAWLGTETVVVARSANYPYAVPAVLGFTAKLGSRLVTAAQLPVSGQ